MAIWFYKTPRKSLKSQKRSLLPRRKPCKLHAPLSDDQWHHLHFEGGNISRRKSDGAKRAKLDRAKLSVSLISRTPIRKMRWVAPSLIFPQNPPILAIHILIKTMWCYSPYAVGNVFVRLAKVEISSKCPLFWFGTWLGYYHYGSEIR